MRALTIGFLALTVFVCSTLHGFDSTLVAKDPEKLPWEASYEVAREKAVREKRPLFVMMTATWCGPCKSLESKTLPDDLVLKGLEDFVWVQAFEDKSVEAKYGCNGYPTLAFVDPASDKVLYKTVGFQAAGPFLKVVIAARQEAGLKLNERLERLAAKVFTPDFRILQEMVEKGDAAGLKKYLEPVDDDIIRESDYLVGKILVPKDVPIQKVIAPALINGVLPESGLFVKPIPRDSKQIPINIIAPGCKAITNPVRVPDKQAVVFKKLELKKLTPKDAVKFAGRVILPDGKPASNAIVRICDWEVSRTDKDGKFKFDRVSPGNFLVRAEYPGGEYHSNMDFGKEKIQKSDLQLTPVTTVGIRWAIQSEPKSRKLVGEGVDTGVAYFSVKNSRFLLDRGAVVRQFYGSDFMLADKLEVHRKFMTEDQVRKVQQDGENTPFFWLFDGSGRNGLHLETDSFDSIEEVSAEATENPKFFQFLRGDKVDVGAVYTLRTCIGDRYAKMEILSVDPPAK